MLCCCWRETLTNFERSLAFLFHAGPHKVCGQFWARHMGIFLSLPLFCPLGARESVPLDQDEDSLCCMCDWVERITCTAWNRLFQLCFLLPSRKSAPRICGVRAMALPHGGSSRG